MWVPGLKGALDSARVVACHPVGIVPASALPWKLGTLPPALRGADLGVQSLGPVPPAPWGW